MNPPPDLLDVLNGTSDDATAGAAAWEAVFAQLRLIASRHRRQRGLAPGSTDDVVQQAILQYLQARQKGGEPWAHPRQFFAFILRTLQNCLADRGRWYQRHGGRPVDPPDDRAEREGPDPDLADVAALLTRFRAEVGPDTAEVFRLRAIEGLPFHGIARRLGLSEDRVREKWTFARVWFADKLGGPVDRTP